jgi:rubrerythrin
MQLLKQIQTAVAEQLTGETESIQTTLYTCRSCDTTYIGSTMDTCPVCQAALEEVPSGAELGYTTASA